MNKLIALALFPVAIGVWTGFAVALEILKGEEDRYDVLVGE